MRANCIQIIADRNNKETSYIIEVDKSFNTKTLELSSKELKDCIRTGKIEVSNLILTQDNRLLTYPNDINKPKKYIIHTPNKRIPVDQRDYIRLHGLIHFFASKYYEDTKRYGLRTYWGKHLYKREKDMIWFFVNDNPYRKYGIDEYMKKKASWRADDIHDICFAVWHPTNEEIDNLRYRPRGNSLSPIIQEFKSAAIVTTQDIPADRLMIGKAIDLM